MRLARPVYESMPLVYAAIGGLAILLAYLDAPLLANPSGPGRFPLMRRCRLLIGYLPNLVGSALPEGKSAAVAATRNTQTGS